MPKILQKSYDIKMLVSYAKLILNENADLHPRATIQYEFTASDR